MNGIFESVLHCTFNTNRKIIYKPLVEIISTTENKLLIYVFVLRQAYELRKLSNKVLILSKNDSAYVIGKKIDWRSRTIMNTKKMYVYSKSWADRPVHPR